MPITSKTTSMSHSAKRKALQSKNKGTSSKPKKLREEPPSDQQAPTQRDVSTPTDLQIFAIRWDTPSISDSAIQISINPLIRVPMLRKALCEMLGLKEQGITTDDLEIYAVTLPSDFRDSISRLSYDGNDQVELKKLGGMGYARDSVNLEDPNLLLVARPQNPDAWATRNLQVLAIRWDTPSISDSAIQISINPLIRVPMLRKALCEMLGLKEQGFTTDDLEIYAVTLPSDFRDSISRLSYDGNDQIELKKLGGMGHARDSVNLEDPNLLLVARPQNPDAWTIRGLRFRDPMPLVTTTGVMWDFQRSSELVDQLSEPLLKHLRHYRTKDKSDIPLYSFASGVGTGKSRNAQEFLNTCIEAVKGYPEHKRLKDARVFHIGLENGSSFQHGLEGGDVDAIIGARILRQLLQDPLTNDSPTIKSIYQKGKIPQTMEILKSICSNDGKDFTQDWTAVLVVDGLQQLMNDGDTTLIKEFLANLSSLTLNGSLIIVCVTATIYTPLSDYHKISRQVVIDLPVSRMASPSVNTEMGVRKIFDEENPMVSLLVDDCGGHGRALEALYVSLARMKEVEAGPLEQGHDILPLSITIPGANINALIRNITKSIKNLYGSPLTRFPSCELAGLLRSIIGRKALTIDETIPGTTIKVESIMGRGLFRFVRKGSSSRGYVEAPYIWVAIMVEDLQEAGDRGLDPIFRLISLYDYNKITSVQGGTVSLQPSSWKGFENFVASFRALKSRLFKDGEEVKVGDFHAGAFINLDSEKTFINRYLEVDILEGQTETKSSSSKFEVKKVYLNAPSAPYGDIVVTVETLESGTKVEFNEVGQCKLYQQLTSINQTIFDREKDKSAVPGVDLFLLYTSKEIRPGSIKLDNMEGYVDGSRWNDYFGPFAGRAMRFYGKV